MRRHLIRTAAAVGTAAALLAALAGSPAHAQEVAATPRIVLEVEGSCPPRQAVRAALEPRLQVVQTGPAWKLSVQRAGSAARMVLHDPAGQAALERSIDSDDCPALGQAIAFIVDAQLVQLRLLPARIEAAPGWAQGPPTATVPSEITPSGPRPPAQLRLAVGGGVGLGLGGFPTSTQARGGGQLDVAFSPVGQAFLLRLAVSAAGQYEQVARGGTVKLVPVVLRLEGGLRRSIGRVYGQVTGLVGLGLVQSVAELGGQNPDTRVNTALLLGASLVGGVQLTPVWSLRLEATPHVFVPWYDRAPISVPEESPPVTRDPLVLLHLLLSIEAALPL